MESTVKKVDDLDGWCCGYFRKLLFFFSLRSLFLCEVEGGIRKIKNYFLSAAELIFKSTLSTSLLCPSPPSRLFLQTREMGSQVFSRPDDLPSHPFPSPPGWPGGLFHNQFWVCLGLANKKVNARRDTLFLLSDISVTSVWWGRVYGYILTCAIFFTVGYI